jgi:hypothetical protein
MSLFYASMKSPPPAKARVEPWSFPRKVLLVAFALLLALMAWQLLDLIMLVFGAVIVATVLRALAARVRQISAEFARFRIRLSLQINELALSVRKYV